MGKVLKGLALLAVVGLVFGATAQAATILLVSDAWDPADTTAEKNHNDDSLVAYLEMLDHTVDTSGMGEGMREAAAPFSDPVKLAAMNAADLIIVSRRTNSGAYDNDTMKHAWNELETPLLLMSGYLSRGASSSNKWGWSKGGSGNATATETDMAIEAGAEGHPFLGGLTGPITMFDWTGSAAGQAPKGIYGINNASEIVGEATVIGTIGGKVLLVDIPAGTDFDAKNETTDRYGVAGARRAFLTTWGYDDNWNATGTGLHGPGGTMAAFDQYLTDDFKTVLEATITTLIPEPGTITMLVMGMFGLALYGVRRRK